MNLGIEAVEDLQAGLEALYETGMLPGDGTGWKALDAHYTVGPQQWTLVTGEPGMGKSELLDAMTLNLAEQHKWHFAVFSPENQPTRAHLSKIVEKRVRKPFSVGPTDRMTLAEMRAARDWVLERFTWLTPDAKSIFEVLDAAQLCRQRGEKFGVVIDPWNQMTHVRPEPGMSETDYIGEVLTYVSRWCRREDLHVFVVAHPTKLARDTKTGQRPVPGPYDIHGSAHWFNKGDNILCVHRDKINGGQNVDVHIQKVRFKHVGSVGLVGLKYDRITGRYWSPLPGTESETTSIWGDPEAKYGSATRGTIDETGNF